MQAANRLMAAPPLGQDTHTTCLKSFPMNRRQALVAATGAAAGLAGCTSVLGPRGRFSESTSLDEIVLQAAELPEYQLQEQSRETFRGELTALTRTFEAPSSDAVSPPELASTAGVYPSPRRAANAVDDLARVDYGRSVRYELEGRSTLEWTGAGLVRIGATDSNLFLLIETNTGSEEQVEQATAYLQRMFADIPPHSSPDSS